MNIEQDIVLMHGRWCLAQVADRQYLTRDTGARERIQGIMDQRRSDLTTKRRAVCVGAAL